MGNAPAAPPWPWVGYGTIGQVERIDTPGHPGYVLEGLTS